MLSYVMRCDPMIFITRGRNISESDTFTHTPLRVNEFQQFACLLMCNFDFSRFARSAMEYSDVKEAPCVACR